MNKKDNNIEFGDLAESSLQDLLFEKYKDVKKIIIVDENTSEHCLPLLLYNISGLDSAEVVVIPPGESSKSLELAAQIWAAFTEYGVNRNDLVINLGGGVVTDLGGFVASVYKRGIDFINIPTSLLAMVDASIGGKTGIDFENFKNQLGTFSYPEKTYIDLAFLESLAPEEFLSGKAEMYKHALLSNNDLWHAVKDFNQEHCDLEVLKSCVKVKFDIVEQDPKEQHLRKALNLGHTIGHAIESYLFKQNVSHGICVAWGILAEAYMSHNEHQLSKVVFEEILELVVNHYPKLNLNPNDFDLIVNIMRQDKKNHNDQINFILLKDFGGIEIDHNFSIDQIAAALSFISSVK